MTDKTLTVRIVEVSWVEHIIDHDEDDPNKTSEWYNVKFVYEFTEGSKRESVGSLIVYDYDDLKMIPGFDPDPDVTEIRVIHQNL